MVLNVDEENVVYMFEKKGDKCAYLCFFCVCILAVSASVCSHMQIVVLMSVLHLLLYPKHKI